MANISTLKRQKYNLFLEELRKKYNDDYSVTLLNQIQEELNEKKYGLVWEEHTENVDQKMETHIPVFYEDIDKEIINDENEDISFIIEGDNLHSLNLLEKTHSEKVDVIYIDPPYNTGSDNFIYDDKIVDDNDGYRHSKWLSFMEKRLTIARELLKDDGFIFISIDDNEMAQLKLLCDQIFGEKNFVNSIAVKMSEATSVKMAHVDKRLPKYKEYILFYKKNNINVSEVKIPKKEWDSEYKHLIKGISREELNELKNIMDTEKPSNEEISRGDELASKITLSSIDELFEKHKSETTYNTLDKMYDGTEKITKEKNKIIFENAYRIVRDVAMTGGAKKIADEKKKNIDGGAFVIETPRNLVYLIKSDYNHETSQPRMKLLFADQYLEYNVGDFWTDIKTTGLGNEGGVDFKNGKKPLQLIKRILDLHPNKNGIVLDFFAGSGTTGQATLQLNEQDGGNRRFILCSNDENNIAEEKTYERIKNTNKSIPVNVKYYKTDFIKKLSVEEELTSNKLMDYMKYLIELQYMKKIDNLNTCLVFTIGDLEGIINTDTLSNNARIFKPAYLLLTRDQEAYFLEKNIKFNDIPEYYFIEEIREGGEI